MRFGFSLAHDLLQVVNVLRNESTLQCWRMKIIIMNPTVHLHVHTCSHVQYVVCDIKMKRKKGNTIHVRTPCVFFFLLKGSDMSISLKRSTSLMHAVWHLISFKHQANCKHRLVCLGWQPSPI